MFFTKDIGDNIFEFGGKIGLLVGAGHSSWAKEGKIVSEVDLAINLLIFRTVK